MRQRVRTRALLGVCLNNLKTLISTADKARWYFRSLHWSTHICDGCEYFAWSVTVRHSWRIFVCTFKLLIAVIGWSCSGVLILPLQQTCRWHFQISIKASFEKELYCYAAFHLLIFILELCQRSFALWNESSVIGCFSQAEDVKTAGGWSSKRGRESRPSSIWTAWSLQWLLAHTLYIHKPWLC